WKGTAYCAYGVPFEMVLTLDYLPGGATTALNKVSLKGNVGEVVIASYTLRGTYDVATYKLSLQPENWVGGFAATTWLDRYSVRFKARHAVATGHRGMVVDAAATALLFRFGDFSTSASAQTSWIGDRYADAYFSVTPTQATRSGLPAYDAKRGFLFIGGSLNGYVNVRRNWSLNPYVSYRYIFDDIAATPIIAQKGDRNQWVAGFHLLREFQFGKKSR
ncbi:MAG: MipA/OmpV family protein, partial [Parvularculaceae bacterium]|nr:MipA/OmpV family protein [Parvularculaceae bacterium]